MIQPAVAGGIWLPNETGTNDMIVCRSLIEKTACRLGIWVPAPGFWPTALPAESGVLRSSLCPGLSQARRSDRFELRLRGQVGFVFLFCPPIGFRILGLLQDPQYGRFFEP